MSTPTTRANLAQLPKITGTGSAPTPPAITSGSRPCPNEILNVVCTPTALCLFAHAA